MGIDFQVLEIAYRKASDNFSREIDRSKDKRAQRSEPHDSLMI